MTTPPGVSTSSGLGNFAQTFRVSVVVWTVLSVMKILPGWSYALPLARLTDTKSVFLHIFLGAEQGKEIAFTDRELHVHFIDACNGHQGTGGGGNVIARGKSDAACAAVMGAVSLV